MDAIAWHAGVNVSQAMPGSLLWISIQTATVHMVLVVVNATVVCHIDDANSTFVHMCGS